MHGGNLVRAALALDPTLSFTGIGGPSMRAAGVTTVVDASEMAVVGVVEVLKHLGTIKRAYDAMKQLLAEKPAAIVLIDYPDFNLLVARVAKRLHVPVLFYISPQVWAWRTGRVHKIKRLVDQMAVVFPFEVPFYEKAGVPVTFVGHPLLDTVGSTMTRDEAVCALGLDPARPVVGLFPGSRRSEIARLFDTVLGAGRFVASKRPDAQFVLPLASSLTEADIDELLRASGLPVTVTRGNVHDVMRACDVAATVSGTVTLELALMGVPMSILYKVAPLSYAIGKRLIRIDHIGLCNIVAGERVVPERIQHEATPEKIGGDVISFLSDPTGAAAIREKLLSIRHLLGDGGASARVARLLFDLISAKQIP